MLTLPAYLLIAFGFVNFPYCCCSKMVNKKHSGAYYWQKKKENATEIAKVLVKFCTII